MFVTTSKNANILQKRFSKYLTNYLPDIEYIPRGNTSLKKILEKATYLGHKFFLKVSFIKGNISLLIYVFKSDTFYLEREYLLEVIDLRHLKPFSYILSINNLISDKKKVFYFLDKKYFSEKSKYGIFYNSEDVFEFLEDDEYLGFKFKILNVKKFD
jgi:rRNA maturation protein Rpf1